MDLAFDEIAIASGSGQTHAGLLFGLRALACPVRVTGVCVRRGRAAQVERIKTHCQSLAEMLEMPDPVEEQDVTLTDDFLAPGYGQLNTPAVEALKLTARSEGILLDPVYTAKGMAGAIHRARSLGAEQNILFVHTGGVPAIFGYESILTDAL